VRMGLDLINDEEEAIVAKVAARRRWLGLREREEREKGLGLRVMIRL